MIHIRCQMGMKYKNFGSERTEESVDAYRSTAGTTCTIHYGL